MSKNEAALPSLAPGFFFAFRGSLTSIKRDAVETKAPPIERAKYQLPHYSWLLDEQPFADVYMGWHADGLSLAVEVRSQFEESRYPLFEDGDSLELFIDTRDMKEATYAHRFCHHFLILPVEVQGVRALEITRLRADDKRPLCDPQDISVDAEFSKRKYRLRIDLPTSCLYGFDPAVCDRVGFTYRLNRATGAAQHFAISSRSCSLIHYPSLWASLKLTA